MKFESSIKSEKELRELYGQPIEAAIKKQKSELDEAAIEFIQNSPFLCLATTDPNNSVDCSPKGDPCGFVKILDKTTIAIPDRKGNNRLDGIINILHDEKVGILFLIPKRNETLRVNGRATLVTDTELLESMAVNNRPPKLAIVVNIDEVFLHCPKAFFRAKLWEDEVSSESLKSYMRLKKLQLGIPTTDEEIAIEAEDYKKALKDKLY